MSLVVNLNLIGDENLILEGAAPVSDLGFGFEDEVVRFSHPLTYRLLVQRLEDCLLVTGTLELQVTCDCVRCLKPVPAVLNLKDWVCHIPLQGEDQPAVVRDAVDLTPYIREDMVLALPTHPVCREDCPGLTGNSKKPLRNAAGVVEGLSSPWEELNKLKLKS